MVMVKEDCGLCDKLRCGLAVSDKQTFYTFALKLICQITDAVITLVNGGSTGSQVTNLYNEVAFGSITNAFTALLTDAHSKRSLVVDNETNEALYISFDGTNIHDFVSPSSASVYKLGEIGRYEASNVYVKYVTAAPTAGLVSVRASY